MFQNAAMKYQVQIVLQWLTVECNVTKDRDSSRQMTLRRHNFCFFLYDSVDRDFRYYRPSESCFEGYIWSENANVINDNRYIYPISGQTFDEKIIRKIRGKIWSRLSLHNRERLTSYKLV